MIETVLVAVTAWSLFEPYWFKTKRVRVISGKIPSAFSGLSVVFVSDIHCSQTFSLKRVEGLVRRINRLKADIVVFGGDYITFEPEYIAPLFERLKNIKSAIGVFGVLGNHDYDHDEGGKITRLNMEKAGIKILDNTGYWIEKDGARIRIGGTVDEASEMERDIASAINGATKDDFVMLVSHNPSYAKKLPEDAPVDLMLCGHTHGGQLRPLGILASLANKSFGERYNRGAKMKNGGKVYVSSGVGMVLVPLRLFARPEVMLITLEKGEEKK